MTTIASASISAEGTFTDPARLEGYFNVSVSGAFVGTVSVQRSIDNVNWNTVNTFQSSFEGTGFDPEFMWYRIGIATGDYTSGTANVRLGREDKDRH